MTAIREALAQALRGIADGFDQKPKLFRPDSLVMSTIRRAADELDAASAEFLLAARAALAAQPAPITGDWRTAAISYLRSEAENRMRTYSGNPSMETTADTIMRLAENLELLQQASPYGLDALAAQPAQAWVSVTKRMPTAGVKVLVCYRNNYGSMRRTCAHYSPLHTVDASTWDEGEPDETEDGTFEPEGWWEEPVELERMEFIADEVTHWMPLPAPPESKP